MVREALSQSITSLNGSTYLQRQEDNQGSLLDHSNWKVNTHVASLWFANYSIHCFLVASLMQVPTLASVPSSWQWEEKVGREREPHRLLEHAQFHNLLCYRLPRILFTSTNSVYQALLSAWGGKSQVEEVIGIGCPKVQSGLLALWESGNNVSLLCESGNNASARLRLQMTRELPMPSHTALIVIGYIALIDLSIKIQWNAGYVTSCLGCLLGVSSFWLCLTAVDQVQIGELNCTASHLYVLHSSWVSTCSY